MANEDEWEKRAFDRHGQVNTDLLKASLDAARDALRAALLLNGGACIALLGFLASLGGKEVTRISLSLINPAKSGLTWFALGAFCAALASGLAYLTNSFYANAASAVELSSKHPYIITTARSERIYRWGKIVNWAAVAVVFLSYASFLFGLLTIGVRF